MIAEFLLTNTSFIFFKPYTFFKLKRDKQKMKNTTFEIKLLFTEVAATVVKNRKEKIMVFSAY